MKLALLASTLVCVLALGCDKPAETKDTAKNAATTTNASATVAATTVTPPAPVTIADTDLSTPADFEEAAEKAITAKTYKAELATLEKDISTE
jgi:hypothetical protein